MGTVLLFHETAEPSLCLLNYFHSELNPYVKRDRKINKSSKREGESSLLMVRKLFGRILLFISTVFGAVTVGTSFGEPIVAILFVYLLTSALPSILALFLIKGRQAIVFNRWGLKSFFLSKGVRIYVLITIITPILLKSIDTLHFNNWDRLSGPEDVYFANLSVEWMGYASVITGLLAFIFFIGIFVFGWRDSTSFQKYMFILSLSFALILSVVMRNDYKAINPDGLVISTLGEKEEISWSDVEHAYLTGELNRKGYRSNVSNHFQWEFEFLLKNGESETFGPFSYTSYNLEASTKIKELLADKRISLTTDRLTDKEWDYVQIDMDYEEEAKPEDFYSVFQYNPKTKEYYTIPY